MKVKPVFGTKPHLSISSSKRLVLHTWPLYKRTIITKLFIIKSTIHLHVGDFHTSKQRCVIQCSSVQICFNLEEFNYDNFYILSCMHSQYLSVLNLPPVQNSQIIFFSIIPIYTITHARNCKILFYFVNIVLQ